ncbi:MAG: twin-arginine translocation pathway signal protein [Acidobacteria bacterium]|nr:twin-arginine translocation pathway signal protein [Acidobacteriota bacterium]
MSACGGGEAPAPGAAEAPPAAEEKPSFIPADFQPPTLWEGDGYKVVPLGPDLTEIDYKAYMSSIEHLQKTFTYSTGWPNQDVTMEDAVKDMDNEKRRFDTRESFAYAVLTPDGTRERGCVYVRPSGKQGYDAAVRMWVTQEEFDAGFDAKLFEDVKKWVAETWPFEKVAYPGREISMDEWKALPDKG